MDLKEWIQQKKILRSQLNVRESYNAKKQFQIEEILFLLNLQDLIYQHLWELFWEL